MVAQRNSQYVPLNYIPPQYLVEATVSWINLPAHQYQHVSPEVGQEAWHSACRINSYPSGNNVLHVECMQYVDQEVVI